MSDFARFGQKLGVLAVFMGLATAQTWPLVLDISRSLPPHPDPLFSVWRLTWVTHWVTTRVGTLFDSNIFFPARTTFALSDATLVQALVGMPLLRAGVGSIATYNLLVLAGYVTSGLSLYALARRCRASWIGAVLGGVIFAFAPYRVEQAMHLEMLWAAGTPLALWGLIDCLERPTARSGLKLAAGVALQTFSCLYYGAFLAPLLLVFAGGWLVVSRQVSTRLLMAGSVAVVAGAVAVGPYLLQYHTAREELSRDVATRGFEELERYSPNLDAYVVTPATNVLYGWTSQIRGKNEGRLFPGLTAVTLAFVGLVCGRKSPLAVALFAGLVFTVDASLGVHGWSFPSLQHLFPGFGAIRAPARFAQLGLACLGMLAALGLTRLGSLKVRWAEWVAVGVCLLAISEYWVRPTAYVRMEVKSNELSRWLANQDDAVLFQWPAPDPASLPDPDPIYVFESTKHWRRMVNGYSGFYPAPYLSLLGSARDFPTTRTLNDLRRLGATHLILHPWRMSAEDFQRLRQDVERRGARLAGCFDGPFGVACAYLLTAMPASSS